MVLSDREAACTLSQAGWPAALIPTMVSIGHLESGLDTGAVNNDPSVADAPPTGWLQVRAFADRSRRWDLRDPVQNAQAGLAVYQSQGLGAWTTSSAALAQLPRVEASLHGWDASQCGGAPSSQPQSLADVLGLGESVRRFDSAIVAAAQIVLGLAVLLAGLLLLASGTGAGRGIARRGLRAVPALRVLA